MLTVQTTENLMLKWDTMGKTWNDNDIIGCIIPNIADNIVRTLPPPQELGGARHFVKNCSQGATYSTFFRGSHPCRVELVFRGEGVLIIEIDIGNLNFLSTKRIFLNESNFLS